jgi:uncharacterized protein
VPPSQSGKILRIHISEGDQYQGKPLYEAIVSRCRDLQIAGATVFQGLEGYGETAEIHRAHLVHSDRPIVIVIVDQADKLDGLVTALEPMIGSGLMALSVVEMVRVQKSQGT